MTFDLRTRIESFVASGQMDSLVLTKTYQGWQASRCRGNTCAVHISADPLDALDYVLADTLEERLAVMGRATEISPAPTNLSPEDISVEDLLA